jgi:hypothetical protein
LTGLLHRCRYLRRSPMGACLLQAVVASALGVHRHHQHRYHHHFHHHLHQRRRRPEERWDRASNAPMALISAGGLAFLGSTDLHEADSWSFFNAMSVPLRDRSHLSALRAGGTM